MKEYQLFCRYNQFCFEEKGEIISNLKDCSVFCWHYRTSAEPFVKKVPGLKVENFLGTLPKVNICKIIQRNRKIGEVYVHEIS